jgi:hypothetical protein
MIMEHQPMLGWACSSTWFFILAAAATMAAGCQEPNPRSCIDGTCTDPSLPFCDVDGALAGEPETCIAVACTPGEFAACRGDQAITCNSEGTSYDLVQCPKGCDAIGGCRVCDPNQTVCANGKVQTCDSSGAVTDSETCPLGCFANEPRCTKLVPSNGLSQYLDLAAQAPDLDLESIRIDTTTGEVLDVVANAPVLVPNYNVTVPGAPSIKIFIAHSAHLRRVSVVASEGGGSAFAFMTKDELRVSGPVKVAGNVGVPTMGCNAGMGHYRIDDGTSLPLDSTGAGGGGNVTSGGAGGGLSDFFASASGGAPVGTERIVPLQGGCPPGDLEGRTPYGVGGVMEYTYGGGAIQLVSETSIVLDGMIDVRGQRGGFHGEQEWVIISGGGAGGAVLLEAPVVTMTDRAVVMAKGGGGGSLGAAPPVDDTGNPDPGVGCYSPPCSPGGQGGAVNIPPTSADNVVGTAGAGYAGGGGGSVGRLRVNTAAGTYSKTSHSLEVAASTTGTIETK